MRNHTLLVTIKVIYSIGNKVCEINQNLLSENYAHFVKEMSVNSEFHYVF